MSRAITVPVTFILSDEAPDYLNENHLASELISAMRMRIDDTGNVQHLEYVRAANHTLDAEATTHSLIGEDLEVDRAIDLALTQQISRSLLASPDEERLCFVRVLEQDAILQDEQPGAQLAPAAQRSDP